MMVTKDFENKSKKGGTALSVKKDHEKEAIHLEDLNQDKARQPIACEEKAYASISHKESNDLMIDYTLHF